MSVMSIMTLAVLDLEADLDVIAETDWDLMVAWTKAHAAKAQKATWSAEQKLIALGNDV